MKIPIILIFITSLVCGGEIPKGGHGDRQWLFSETNDKSELDGKQFSRFQDCEKIIHEVCSKNYTFRWIVPRPIDASASIRVVSLTKANESRYLRETVSFSFDDKAREWKFEARDQKEIDPLFGERAIAIAEQFLKAVTACCADARVLPGNSIARWELCLRGQERKIFYSGDELGPPVNPIQLAAYSQLISVMFD